MGIEVRSFAEPSQAGAAMAADIVARLARHRAATPFLLGCPGGRTPRPVYAAIAEAAGRDLLDLSKVVIVMMDEYLIGPQDALRLPPADAHFSCRGFAEREIRAVLNANLPATHQIPSGQVWLPNPDDPGSYDKRIEDAGGIDYFILASGAGDGHVAFNPPGSPADSPTRIVRLAEQTRRDNLVTFPDFDGIDAVPSFGITIGTGTIAGHSKAAGMLLWGADKRQAFDRIAGADGYDGQWPATVAAACDNCVLFADVAATGEAA